MNIPRHILVVGAIALSTATTPTIWAQYTADFQTNTISGVTSNWPGTYYVGDTNSADVLVIQSHGVLNDQIGYLGIGSKSSNNIVLVTDSGSIWSNGFLIVGDFGFGNSLVVSNGGQVLNAGPANVGGGPMPRISNNSALVTGSGSVWSNGGDLMVGGYQAGNRVAVNNGGLLINNNAFLGSAGAPSGSNNSALVSGSGSVWTNLGDMNVGETASGCSLAISNGGKVFDGYAYVGFQISANSNTAMVNGAGSVWTNRNDLYVGNDGARNSLLILNSGTVYNLTGYIGNDATASNNSVVVGGSGSAWRNTYTLNVGVSSPGNSLVISNGGYVENHFGGGFVGFNLGSSNNHVLVTDPGSIWSNGFIVEVGFTSGGNSLIISNGGRVINNGGTVGDNASSVNNRVVVTGSGSVWSNSSGNLFVGRSGTGNSLIISNGGQVFDGAGVVSSSSPGGSNNSVFVSGLHSAWRNSFNMVLGGSGSSDSLTINGGGLVANSDGIIGTGGSGKNSVSVSDVGSVWSNANNLYVGQDGSSNSLVIQFTVGVFNTDAYIGYSFRSRSNTVRVLGDMNGLVATSWRAGVLHVGELGSANSLIISGSVVCATNLIVGVDSATCDNLVQLDGGGVLAVTNVTHDAVLEVRDGELILNSGTVQADILVITNACARFVRNGGTLIVDTLVLDPNLSAVGDGIPNGWKQQYGLDPFDPNLGNEDADGDGMSNLQEYLAGSNPVADIRAITREGNNIRVTWGAALGKTNALQSTTGDVDGSYSNNFADIFVVNGSVSVITNYLDAGAAINSPTRYYRVRLVP